jgi:AcrR family transcriptional regulator
MRTMPLKRGKSTQRERLLMGMIDVANRGGYASANVSAVIERAGVSRPTFYDYFADRDACFLAAIDDVQQRLRERTAEAVEAAPPQQALAATVDALVAFARDEPTDACFLMSESMTGGTGALAAREDGIRALSAAIEKRLKRADPDSVAPDLAPSIAIGAAYRVLAARLRRGEPALAKLSEEMLAWLASYERPLHTHRWGTLKGGPALAHSPHLPQEPFQMPGLLPLRGQWLPQEEVAANHRMRILYAAAQLAVTKGSIATTLLDITTLARMDGEAFYRIFANKQDAFMGVHELGFQQVMDVTSKAFFAGTDWPQRSWEAGRALTQLLDQSPLYGYIGFVEAYSVGPAAVQRIEDSLAAFMFFLQEGQLSAPADSAPSRLEMEAIVSSVFEVIYIRARRAGRPEFAKMLPQIAHLWLTPFLGTTAADEYIDSQRPKVSARPPQSAR